MNSKESPKHFRRSAVVAALLVSSVALLVGGMACNELAGLLGPTGDKIQCTITGTAVGFDGGEVNKLDLNWYPSESAGTSDTIDGTVDGGSFEVTGLVIPSGSQRVQGELAIGEAPTPPLALKYGQTRIEIDLPAGACTMDLGEVVLPEKGSEADQTDDPIPGENNGTNNGGSTNNDTTGMNNAEGTNNDTLGENNDEGTNNGATGTNDGT